MIVHPGAIFDSRENLLTTEDTEDTEEPLNAFVSSVSSVVACFFAC